jgi:hypothetical protein
MAQEKCQKKKKKKKKKEEEDISYIWHVFGRQAHE